MFRPLLALLFPVSLLILAALLHSQEPVQGEPRESPQTSEERRAAQIEKLKQAEEEATRQRLASNVETLRKMQGTWQLLRYTAPDMPDEGRESVGFMIVAGEFLSLEVHMGYFDEDGIEESSFIQTGTYRLNFNTFSDLIATCLIGSIDDGTGLTAPQPPGLISVYTVDIAGNELTFLAEDGAKLTLDRVATGRLTDLVYEDLQWLPGATNAAPKSPVATPSAEQAPVGAKEEDD